MATVRPSGSSATALPTTETQFSATPGHDSDKDNDNGRNDSNDNGRTESNDNGRTESNDPVTPGRYPTPPPIIETEIPLPLQSLAASTWAEYDDANDAVLHACQDAGFGVSKDRSVIDPRTGDYKRVNYSCWRGSRRDKIPIPDSQRKRKRTTHNCDCPWNGSLKKYHHDNLWHFVYIAGRMHHNHEMSDHPENIAAVKRQARKSEAANRPIKRPVAQAGEIPKVGARAEQLAPSNKQFLDDHPTLRIAGDGDLHTERRRHLQVFGWHALETARRAPIGRVIYVGVRTRHGTVICRLFYPQCFFHTGQPDGTQKLPALIYFHGGTFALGSVDEYENGLRLVAEAASVIVVGVEFHLAPEHPYPTQLDQYEDVLGWAQGNEGAYYGLDGDRVIGGGDSSGGTFTAAICLRLKDQEKKQMRGQVLLYPQPRLPFDTASATDNHSGNYLEANGILSFTNYYMPRAPEKSYPLADRYVMPGMQDPSKLGSLPHAAVFTCGFDPLRDVGLDYAARLRAGGNRTEWYHYPDLTHGFLQMAPWSPEAMKATLDVASTVKKMAYF